MITFYNKLDSVSKEKRSLLCVGLDPDPRWLPDGIKDVFSFNQMIIDVTSEFVCAYKPNLAFYEVLGESGYRILKDTIDYIRYKAPNVVIIGDAKRGDIGVSTEKYAEAIFEKYEFDAVTVNMYGGFESIEPFLKYSGKGVFIWTKSSNPGGNDIQNAQIKHNGKYITICEYIASLVNEKTDGQNLGLVIGATFPKDILQLRNICPKAPFLIPGVGQQKGELVSSIRNGLSSIGMRVLISSSRYIIKPSVQYNFLSEVYQKSKKLYEDISKVVSETSEEFDIKT